MPMFCKLCNNLLSIITTADEFYFKCVKCQINYTPDKKDSLRYEDTTGANLVIYKTILKNAGRDPVNPKVKKKCKKCKNTIVKQVRLSNDLRLINVCIKCNNQWLEGSLD